MQIKQIMYFNVRNLGIMEYLLDSSGKKDKYYTSFEKNQSVRPIRIEQLLKEVKESTEDKKQCMVECDEINCIGDLIQLALKYPPNDSIEYTNIRIESLHKIVPHLKQLDEMIGLNSLKKSITDQLIYYLQPTDKTNDYKHTIISGPPGTGKTEIAKLIGNIFSLLGVFGNNGPAKFKQVSRGDLVAGYLGQTAIKTNEVINSCLGGVLFIDEAYSLGNVDKRDAYSKECIDTLCDALSSHKQDLMVIIAGYESELNDCFFGYNQGLKSRFAWKYNIDGYSAEELNRIFLLKLTKLTNIHPTLEMSMSKWFSKRMNHFTSYGRDIDTFISKIKIAHSRRTFCKTDDGITIADVEKGYESVCLLHPPPLIKQHDLFFYS
jgi:SpoVK/Ycf46/Vps4 family AAA+-type ATPase